MPLAGKGMLITSMDIDPADEQDFNLWYDREHLAERVAIEGFLEARRWIAERAPTKYFCTYSTRPLRRTEQPRLQARCWRTRPTGPRNTSRASGISAGSWPRLRPAAARAAAPSSGSCASVPARRAGRRCGRACTSSWTRACSRDHFDAPHRERPGAVEEPQRTRRAEPRRRRLVRADRGHGHCRRPGSSWRPASRRRAPRSSQPAPIA